MHAVALALAGALTWLATSAGIAQTPRGGSQISPPQSGQISSSDTPTRVGRLARIAGTVSYHPEGADRWEPALANLPVSDGAAFWTEPGAEAEIDITSGRLVMDAGTELDIDGLAALAVNLTVPQGQIYLWLRGMASGETVTILTPRGSVAISAVGRYAIAAGDTETPTRVAVLEGAARVTGPNVSLELGAGQTGVIEGLYDFAARVVTGDGGNRFLLAQAERDQPAPAPSTPPPVIAQRTVPPSGVAPPRVEPPRVEPPRVEPPRVEPRRVEPPPVVNAMPGGKELGAHGTWETTREYGRVWYPRVAANWRPFRDGKWVWLRRGGWTWVDAAPWGFAPSHYGRWVVLRGRWAWWPGAATLPVYVPAMVNFRGRDFATSPGATSPGATSPGATPPGATPPGPASPGAGAPIANVGRPNIVLPPPPDTTPPRPPAPGPILFRPSPGAPAGQISLRPAVPSPAPTR